MGEQNGRGILASIRADDLPRVPQQARSRKKRDALLTAAAHLFAERGYEATTADDIAAAAGVSIGTFYAYFRNKRQVFLTLYANYESAILGLGIADIDFSTNPREAIRATVERARQRDELFVGLRRAAQELLPRDPEIAAYHAEQQQSLYEQILAAVRRVAGQGLTWPQLDVEATSWAITLLLEQMWRGGPIGGEGEAGRARQQDALSDLIYHALFRS